MLCRSFHMLSANFLPPILERLRLDCAISVGGFGITLVLRNSVECNNILTKAWQILLRQPLIDR